MYAFSPVKITGQSNWAESWDTLTTWTAMSGQIEIPVRLPIQPLSGILDTLPFPKWINQSICSRFVIPSCQDCKVPWEQPESIISWDLVIGGGTSVAATATRVVLDFGPITRFDEAF